MRIISIMVRRFCVIANNANNSQIWCSRMRLGLDWQCRRAKFYGMGLMKWFFYQNKLVSCVFGTRLSSSEYHIHIHFKNQLRILATFPDCINVVPHKTLGPQNIVSWQQTQKNLMQSLDAHFTPTHKFWTFGPQNRNFPLLAKQLNEGNKIIWCISIVPKGCSYQTS